ncbi:hypothetical protein [Pseudoalteromonas sp.]|uniref:hypothetical protein n=1 Tax=Pseudoalteromonas sp. TaxID=53249 RepID=UPI002605E88B|nr:hypothetical protein [Pseudoalteromonas sp.]MCP4585317.1 hypothetical protein [Pseudoalteromonas sp.]
MAMTDGEATLKINEIRTFLAGLQTIISDVKGFLSQIAAKKVDLDRLDALETQYGNFTGTEKTALGALGASTAYLVKLKACATAIDALDFSAYTHILNGTEPEA